MTLKDAQNCLDEIQQIKHFSIPIEEKKSRIMSKVADGFSLLSGVLRSRCSIPVPETPAIDFKKIEADRLRDRFTLAHDYLMHTNWEVFNLGSIGVPEPPVGCAECYSSGSINEYLTHDKVKTPRLTHIDTFKALSGLWKPENFGIKPVKLGGFEDGDKFE